MIMGTETLYQHLPTAFPPVKKATQVSFALHVNSEMFYW